VLSLRFLTVLLDTGIFSHSEFAEGAILHEQNQWAGSQHSAAIPGVRRKRSHNDPDFQAQVNALPTIGRLIREGALGAYEYSEIWCEQMRYRSLLQFGNALRDCTIQTCQAPLDRTKFMQTIDIVEHISKGGKKDRKAGVQPGPVSQIAFLKFLRSLTPESVDALISHMEHLRLTEFEVDSLRSIRWFQALCERWPSVENLPDIFHLWAAERNGLDVLLTLDNGLPELVSRVKSEKVPKIEIKTAVLHPLDLLARLGITKLDPVPLDEGRFYYVHEVD
jgi:hypothetical protein